MFVWHFCFIDYIGFYLLLLCLSMVYLLLTDTYLLGITYLVEPLRSWFRFLFRLVPLSRMLYLPCPDVGTGLPLAPPLPLGLRSWPTIWYDWSKYWYFCCVLFSVVYSSCEMYLFLCLHNQFSKDSKLQFYSDNII